MPKRAVQELGPYGRVAGILKGPCALLPPTRPVARVDPLHPRTLLLRIGFVYLR